MFSKTSAKFTYLAGCWLYAASPGFATELQPATAFEATYALTGAQALAGWQMRSGGPAGWTIGDGYVEVNPGAGDIETHTQFEQDLRVHLEFWLPHEPQKSGQNKANSGLFILGRYEIQILDMHQNSTYADGACGALYKQIAPSTNACLPPEQWQTLDVELQAPRVDTNGRVTAAGLVTVIVNGVTVINAKPFLLPTGSARKTPQGVPGPIRLQDHGSAVRFRNLQVTTIDR